MGIKIFILSSNKNGYTKFLDLLSRKTYVNKSIKHYSIKSHSGWDVTTIYMGNFRSNPKRIQYDGGIILLDQDDEIQLKLAKDVPVVQITNYKLGHEVKILQSLLMKIVSMD